MEDTEELLQSSESTIVWDVAKGRLDEIEEYIRKGDEIYHLDESILGQLRAGYQSLRQRIRRGPKTRNTGHFHVSDPGSIVAPSGPGDDGPYLDQMVGKNHPDGH